MRFDRMFSPVWYRGEQKATPLLPDLHPKGDHSPSYVWYKYATIEEMTIQVILLMLLYFPLLTTTCVSLEFRKVTDQHQCLKYSGT